MKRRVSPPGHDAAEGTQETGETQVAPSN